MEDASNARGDQRSKNSRAIGYVVVRDAVDISGIVRPEIFRLDDEVSHVHRTADTVFRPGLQSNEPLSLALSQQLSEARHAAAILEIPSDFLTSQFVRVGLY